MENENDQINGIDSGDENGANDELAVDDNELSSGDQLSSYGDDNISLVGTTIGAIFKYSYGHRSNKFICETKDCNTELDGSKLREIICPKCEEKYYNNTSFQINKYKSLDHKESKELNKIIAHINNKIRDNDFAEAYKYCQKAEILAPAEPITWEYFALLEFLYEITRKREERKEMGEIVRAVKSHLIKCKDYNIDEVRYSEISADIANRVFEWGKIRMPAIVTRKDKNNNDVWLLKRLEQCLGYMKCYDLAYSINNTEPKFLEEYIKELSKDYKWIVRDIEGNLKSRVIINGFNPINKFHHLISKITEYYPEYQMPVIAEERFEIIRKEPEKEIFIEIISRTKK
jgi:hypothetical protein